MSIFGETLYWTNPKTKEVNLRDLRCDKTRTYSDIYNDAEVIQEVDDERFVVFYESKCVNIFSKWTSSEALHTTEGIYLDRYSYIP